MGGSYRPYPQTFGGIKMKHLRWILRYAEELISSLFFILMCMAVAFGVFARFFDVSLVWTDELARYSFIWTVFTGSVVAIKHQKHIAIDFLMTLLPNSLQKIVYSLIHVTVCILCLVLVQFGLLLTIETWGVPTTSLGLPTGLIYVPVSLSGLLMMMYVVRDLYKVIKGDLRPYQGVERGGDL